MKGGEIKTGFCGPGRDGSALYGIGRKERWESSVGEILCGCKQFCSFKQWKFTEVSR